MHNLKGGKVSILSSHLIAPIMCINKLNTLYMVQAKQSACLYYRKAY